MTERSAAQSGDPHSLIRLPEWIIWAVAWVALLVAPQSSNLFQFISSSQSSYGELRMPIEKEMVVVAKNSGAGAVRYAGVSAAKQFCLGIVTDAAFIPETRGLIPPATYSVSILPYDGERKPRVVYADGEAEVPAGRLRIMTPLEEMQVGFGAMAMIGVFIWLSLQFHEWYLRDGFLMTGRRSED
jgi:hypothetical protein